MHVNDKDIDTHIEIRCNNDEVREIFTNKLKDTTGIRIVDSETTISIDYLVVIIKKLNGFLEAYRELFTDVNAQNILIVGTGYTSEDKTNASEVRSEDFQNKFITSFLGEDKKPKTKLIFVDIESSHQPFPYDCHFKEFPLFLEEKNLLNTIDTCLNKCLILHQHSDNERCRKFLSLILQVDDNQFFYRLSAYETIINQWLYDGIDDKLRVLKEYLSGHNNHQLSDSIEKILEFIDIAKEFKNRLDIARDYINSNNNTHEKLNNITSNFRKGTDATENVKQLLEIVEDIIEKREQMNPNVEYGLYNKMYSLYLTAMDSMRHFGFTLLLYYSMKNNYVYNLFCSESDDYIRKLVWHFSKDVEYLYDLYKRFCQFMKVPYKACRNIKDYQPIKLVGLFENTRDEHYSWRCHLI